MLNSVVFVLLAMFLFLVHLWNKTCLQFVFLVLLLSLSSYVYINKQNPLDPILINHKANYTAKTISSTLTTNNKTKITLELMLTNETNKQISGRIEMTINAECFIPKKSLITFFSKIKNPTYYSNPGGFNFQKFLHRRNIWGKVFVNSCQDLQILSSPSFSWKEKLRQKLLTQFQHPALQQPEALPALLLGIKSLDPDNKTLIQEAGVSHLFVISGTHFGVMCAMIYGLLGLLSRLFPRIFLIIPKQKIAALGTTGFIFFYMNLIEPAPSVIRASIMVLSLLWAVILNKQNNLLYALCVSASISLLWEPLMLHEASFQFSYLCVLTILVIHKPITKNSFVKKQPRIIKVVLELLILSLTINLVLIPLTVFHFGTFSWQGFIHNIWAIPYFHFIVVPLSLLFLFVHLLIPSFSLYVLMLWDKSLHVFFQTLFFFQTERFHNLFIPKPHALHLVLFYLSLFSFFLLQKKRTSILLFFFLCCSLGMTWYSWHGYYDLKITQLDVGHGDALVIQTQNKTLLIDTGGSRFADIGENVVWPYLQYAWINKIDLLVLTHSDYDHYGGLLNLQDKIKVGEVWVSPAPSNDLTYNYLLENLLSKKIVVKKATAPATHRLDDVTKLTVLSPQENQNKIKNHDNENSLVILLEHKNFRALFTGDITRKTEKKLVKQFQKDLKANLLKIAHHGSKASSSDNFLDAVQPNLALISTGKNKQFNHPHPEILARLKHRRIEILQTDKHGASGIMVKKNELRNFTER